MPTSLEYTAAATIIEQRAESNYLYILYEVHQPI
jgi:hypothetical protein